MDPFVQMLRAAQGGHGLENIARLYGLTPQQAQMAAEALMPAFGAAFRQALQSPETTASLMATMIRGPYAGFYSRFGAPDQLSEAGTTALSTIFGSPEVTRAVANHAAASAGLGAAVMGQMMPGLASLWMGGLTKSLAASGAMQQMVAGILAGMDPAGGKARAPQWTGNPWIDAFTSFMTPPQPSRPATPSTGNPWADAFAQMMLGATPAKPEPARPAGTSWQDVVNAMTSTLAQAGVPRAPAERAPAAAKASKPADERAEPLPFQDFFAQMFAQGFPPGFGGKDAADGGRTSPWAEQAQAAFYAVPDFWREVFSTDPRNRPGAVTPPPEGGAKDAGKVVEGKVVDAKGAKDSTGENGGSST